MNEREKTAREKQQEVIHAINNHFNLSIKNGCITILDEELMPKIYGIKEMENFEIVIEEIKKYIRKNTQNFNLEKSNFFRI